MKPHFLCIVLFEFILYLTFRNENIVFHPLTIILFSKEAGLGPYWKHFDKFGSKCISNEFVEFACHHLLLLDETKFGRRNNFLKVL